MARLTSAQSEPVLPSARGTGHRRARSETCQRVCAPDSASGSRTHGRRCGDPAFLAEKHELTLFTKGEPWSRIARSSCPGWDSIHALPNREREDRSAYEELARVRGFDLELTWMTEQPKSDINPALDAGLRAVFVPPSGRGLWNAKRFEKPAGV